ncbi:MAG: S8 family serine peptidase [Chitinophagaceae bacterium]|nr:S8 family serine peptidase [Chitinophagaceae bacterium]
MKYFPSRLALSLMLLSGLQPAWSQTSVETVPDGWHLLDRETGGVFGISVDKAYKSLLKDRKPAKTIVVAVIDSGIDTAHEDLKPVMWRNEGEIPGNGIDDDRNGYIDDVHGWNFLGSKDGRNVGKDSYEAARVYYRLKGRFGSGQTEVSSLNPTERHEYETYRKAKEQIESQAKEASMYVLFLGNIVEKLPAADSMLRAAIGKDVFTGNELSKLKAETPEIGKAKGTLLGLFQQTQQMENTNRNLIREITTFLEGERGKVEAARQAPRNYRGEVVGDNYEDINDRGYGNNDLMAEDPSHGTHVAGIIGAVRDNGKGVQGVADKKWVDEAVRYAESRGVLLVHAAGNDAKNIDIEDNFPNPKFDNDSARIASNWITVGASGPRGDGIAADFSNHGRAVDVFAPGVEIYSTLPGGNQYGNQQGTSMASPVVAGLAALILSHYPTLSHTQVKEVIERSATPVTDQVIMPGKEEKVSFQTLCRTGGIVNAYEALRLAASLKGNRVMIPIIKTSERKPPAARRRPGN